MFGTSVGMEPVLADGPHIAETLADFKHGAAGFCGLREKGKGRGD